MHSGILSSALIAPRYRKLPTPTAGTAEDRWLSVDEIAKYLGVVKASIYRWIEQKGLPAHKVGKLWKFKRDEVDEWVRSGGAADEASSSEQPQRRKQR